MYGIPIDNTGILKISGGIQKYPMDYCLSAVGNKGQ
jgi:hypothetical protein